MIARAKDLRAMPEADIRKKLADVKVELTRQRAKMSAGGAPENPGRLSLLRRTVARIVTIMQERKIQ